MKLIFSLDVWPENTSVTVFLELKLYPYSVPLLSGSICLPVYHRGTMQRFVSAIFNPRTGGLRIVAFSNPTRGIYPEPDLSHVS